MNRKERRKKEKEAKKDVIKIDRTTLNNIINREVAARIKIIKMEIFVASVHDLTAAFLISISDEFGFGKERLERLLQKVNTTLECILSGHVTLEDIKDWCKGKHIDYEEIFNQGQPGNPGEHNG